MKAKNLISILKKNPEANVIIWDGQDNWDLSNADHDINGIEIVLTNDTMIDLNT